MLQQVQVTVPAARATKLILVPHRLIAQVGLQQPTALPKGLVHHLLNKQRKASQALAATPLQVQLRMKLSQMCNQHKK